MELEKINDKCDQFGIDLVKVSDPEALKVFNVKKVPALAFFRKQKALFYDGWSFLSSRLSFIRDLSIINFVNLHTYL